MSDRWSAPRVLTFMMTYRCNLRCTMCWQWGEQGLFHELTKDHESQQLDLATLRAVIDDVAGEGTGVFLWGGEPFLHRDLMSFVGYVKSKNLYCSINTNGTYLPREARRLVDLGVDAIMVSVDGPREVHDRIRGMNGSFQRIADGVAALRAARNGHAGKPEIIVNTTISRKSARAPPHLRNRRGDGGGSDDPVPALVHHRANRTGQRSLLHGEVQRPRRVVARFRHGCVGARYRHDRRSDARDGSTQERDGAPVPARSPSRPGR